LGSHRFEGDWLRWLRKNSEKPVALKGRGFSHAVKTGI
jgi:hypothetical protein